jgi:hypothetical protein
MASIKGAVILELFNRCQQRNDWTFHNNEVKEVAKHFGFGNAFDVTKVDNSSILPQELADADYFITHLGKGYHQFVKGIQNGYHSFESIPAKDEIDWNYKKSILNEFDSSESNILSVGFNQSIIHHFLYDDIRKNPNIYNARRKKMDLEYRIGDSEIRADKCQIKIDLTLELRGKITIFEGNDNFYDKFEVYQLYHPFLYYFQLKERHNLPINEISCCYLLRRKSPNGSLIRIYEYGFADTYNMASIYLLKSKQYNLKQD